VGTMFIPEKAAESGGQLPLVMTAYGGVLPGGHVIEEKAAVLASHGELIQWLPPSFSFSLRILCPSSGFCTLALAFFGVGSLPKRYGEIRVEYFERAIDTAAETVKRQTKATILDKERVSCSVQLRRRENKGYLGKRFPECRWVWSDIPKRETWRCLAPLSWALNCERWRPLTVVWLVWPRQRHIRYSKRLTEIVLLRICAPRTSSKYARLSFNVGRSHRAHNVLALKRVDELPRRRRQRGRVGRHERPG
jgi:hypothetical protein